MIVQKTEKDFQVLVAEQQLVRLNLLQVTTINTSQNIFKKQLSGGTGEKQAEVRGGLHLEEGTTLERWCLEFQSSLVNCLLKWKFNTLQRNIP